MLVGDLVATMRLDGADAFNRGLDQAGANFTNLGTRVSGLGSLVKGAFTAVGNTVNAAGATVLALGTSAIKAGAGFNNMQQNANVALRTLMGSTEAAEKQMAKLNDFANGSPFGRDTLIQAQQQMIGFGIEADKVVPYLGAVQDAVAGIGGSNQDITEIVGIISRIRSGASLGQEDLNQLADRGINAAALIAEATGKTEQEIRDSIFGSPLKGEEALAGLDAMMSGMATRFDGASAGLKENLDGARDRVKAAMRDIGALISAPVIDPKGGGWGVTLTNSYADILRGVQAAITPMVSELALRMTPAFLNIDSAMQGFASTIRQVDMSDLRSGFALISPYLPVIAGGLAAMSAQGLTAIPVLGKLVGAVNPLAAGFLAAAASTPEVREGLARIFDAAKPLGPVVADVAGVLATSLGTGLQIAGDLLSAAAPLVEMFADGISAIPTPVLAAAAAVTVAAGAFKMFSAASTGQAAGGLFGSFAAGTQAASIQAQKFGGVLKEMGGIAQRAHSAGLAPATVALAAVGPLASGASTMIGKVGTALKTAFLTNPVGIVIMGVSTALGAMAIAGAEAKQKAAELESQIESLRGTLDETTGAVTDNTDAQILADLQASQWGTRVEELLGGQASLAQMTTVITGENYKLRDSLVDASVAAFDWDKRMSGGTQSQYTFGKAVEQSGASMEDWMLAAAGNADATEKVTKGLTEYGYSAAEATNMINDLRTSTGEWNNMSMNMEALSYMETEAAKLELAKIAAQQYIDEMNALRNAGGEAAIEQRKLGEAIDIASNSANDASERIRALREAIDILNGGSLTAAEQQQKLDDSIRSTADAFEEAFNAANEYDTALLDASGNIDTSTEYGSKFRDALMGVSDEMYQAGIAAANYAEAMGEDPYQASLDAMRPYVDQLRNLQDEYNLTDEQMQGLLESLGMMPEEIALLMNVDGVDEAAGELGTIGMMLLDLDGKQNFVHVQTLSDEARAKLEELGFQVRELDDGTFSIGMGADTAEAQLKLAQLMAEITGTSVEAIISADTSGAYDQLTAWEVDANGTYTMPTVGADTDPATGEVVAWKLQADGTWAVSHMDAEKAKADSTVITWKKNADGTWSTAHMGADAASAYSTKSTFVRNTNGTWTQVKVNADTSAARAGIDALNGRTITIGVYQKQIGVLRADGGFDEYANGGIKRYAAGGVRPTVPTGIYPGGASITHFAEPETGWEAYISGKRGRETANIGYAIEALKRLDADPWQVLAGMIGTPVIKPFADGGMLSARPASLPPVATMAGLQAGDTFILRVGETDIRAVLEPIASNAASSAVRSYDRDGSTRSAHGRQKGR